MAHGGRALAQIFCDNLGDILSRLRNPLCNNAVVCAHDNHCLVAQIYARRAANARNPDEDVLQITQSVQRLGESIPMLLRLRHRFRIQRRNAFEYLFQCHCFAS